MIELPPPVAFAYDDLTRSGTIVGKVDFLDDVPSCVTSKGMTPLYEGAALLNAVYEYVRNVSVPGGPVHLRQRILDDLRAAAGEAKR